jgi:hypothetical protein
MEQGTPGGWLGDRCGLIALAVYLLLSLAIFGRAVAGHLGDSHFGIGPDPSTFIWSMAWWPYALRHGLNPLFTDYVWSPHGLNLVWMTGIPAASLAMWPVTAVAGPVVSYNVMCLLAPPLAAWTAFLLCRQISGVWWPSLVGGYLFGFSAYILGQLAGSHPHMTLVFLVPLAVLVVVKAIDGQISRRTLVAGLTVILVGQFLISVEVFATMTAAGALIALLGYSFAPREIRSRLNALLIPVALAYGFSLLIVSPYIYGMLGNEWPSGPLWSLTAYSADLLNFIVPTPTCAIGSLSHIQALAAPFSTYGMAEVDAYVGLPVLAVAASYAWYHWREPLGKILVDSFIVVSVLALGPRLHIDGVDWGGLPGKILPLLPVLNKALPARFMMFSFLALSVIASNWLASARRAARTVVAGLLILSTFPNPASAFWVVPDNTPSFFTASMCAHDLGTGETVLVLPFGIRGNSMMWQAQCGMHFRMAGGYTAAVPSSFSDWPIYPAFLAATYLPDPGAQLAAFIAHHGVKAVIVSDRDPDATSWNRLLSSLGVEPRRVGGVALYRVAQSTTNPYLTVTANDMRRRAIGTLLDTLVLAADRWLAQGRSLSSLTPLQAQGHGLLPAQWLTGPTSAGWSIVNTDLPRNDPRYFCGVWLGPTQQGLVGVGVYSPYDAIAPSLARYRQYAVHIYSPYRQDSPRKRSSQQSLSGPSLTVIEFNRKRLREAAARVASSSLAKIPVAASGE